MGHQADQAGHRRAHGVAGLPGQRIARAPAARARIRNTACGHQHPVAPVLAAALAAYAHAAALLQQQLRHLFGAQLGPGGIAHQRPANVLGPVAHREHPAAPLHLQGHAQPLKQGHGRRRVKSGKGGIQKTGVRAHILQKRLQIAVVGHVAAAFARHQNFLARLFLMLQQSDGVALLQRGARGHQPGRARAHNDQMSHDGASFSSLGPASSTAAANSASSG